MGEFSFVSRNFGQSNLRWVVNSFFSPLNTVHTFLNTRKTFGKKAALKPQTREFFLCFALKFFN